MRFLFTICVALSLLFISALSYGQPNPPNNTYNEELRDWLRNNWYINYFQDLGYNNAREEMYSFTDEVDGLVYCLYTGFSQASAFTTFLDPINAEHIIPQSFYGGASPMNSDIHNIRPCHGSANSARSNYPYDEVLDANSTWYGIDEFGAYFSSAAEPTNSAEFSERVGSVWEPRESVKGDVARQVFYFYTMYPTEAGEISLLADVQLLYEWHLQDPVDINEIERNARIEIVQGNRNPFIDFSDLVYDAWLWIPGDGCVDPMACNYDPSATSDDGSCDYTTCYGCTDVDAPNYDPTATIDDGSCAPPFDCETEQAYFGENCDDGNPETFNDVIQNDCSCAGILGVPSFDLIITGVFDGPLTGGVPKGIELKAISDISDLSIYGLGVANNGGGTDGIEYNFPAVSISAGTYFFVSSDAVSANAFFENAIQNFNAGSSIGINGDDAIELYESGQVIDVYGDPLIDGTGQSWEYLDSWTYRNCDSAPSSVFNEDEWTFGGINVLDGLTFNSQSVYPMPVETFEALCPVEFGCTYPEAANYNPLALDDDGSCDFSNLSEDNCPEDVNGDLTVNISDFLQLLSAFGSQCEILD